MAAATTTTAPTTKPKPSAGKGGKKKPRSTRQAVALVLQGASEPMSAEDIYAEIKRRRLAPNLKGKTPVATISAQLSIHGEFERVGRGLYKLAD